MYLFVSVVALNTRVIFIFYRSKINIFPEYYQENAKDEKHVNIWVVVFVYTICPADNDADAFETVN